MADKSGKTEKPTAKKLRDARKEGQFARTPDAATWVGVATAAAMLPYTAHLMDDRFRELFARVPDMAQDPSSARALQAIAELPSAVVLTVGPLALATALAALLATAIQGVHPSLKVLKPKMSRLSPKSGIKRMLGPKSLWEAMKSLLKVLVITLVVYILARTLVPDLIGPGVMPLQIVVARTGAGIQRLLWTAAVVGLLLAAADYAYIRRGIMKELRMSPRDIKDEMRQSEGDPLMKGAIRSRQMSMSRSRMLSAVVDADVVLVNPTHFAVALKYEARRGAPRVVAKGADSLAQKIRERARENRIPVVEDQPLTRLLYRVCDLGDEIPGELYVAVARILAFVMAAGTPGRKAKPRKASSNGELPELPSKSRMRARRARQERESRSAAKGA